MQAGEAVVASEAAKLPRATFRSNSGLLCIPTAERPSFKLTEETRNGMNRKIILPLEIDCQLEIRPSLVGTLKTLKQGRKLPDDVWGCTLD